LYGLPTILLAAAIAPWTSGGADAGATAKPSEPSVASSPAGTAVGSGAGSNTLMPRSTCEVILRASARDTRPLTRRISDRRSHERTRRAVCGPYWPSTSVRSPTVVRLRWSVRTSDPRLPSRSERSPKT
jgi:hypothetical protein